MVIELLADVQFYVHHILSEQKTTGESLLNNVEFVEKMYWASKTS